MAGENKNAALAVLFENWAAAKENWKEATLVVQMKQSYAMRTMGRRIWLTEAQIATKYQDAELAREICSGKENDVQLRKSCVRSHPDVARVLQYLVFDEATESEENDLVVSQLFGQTADVTKDTKEKHKKKSKHQKKRRKSSTTGSSSDSSSEVSSSSSESSRKRRKNKKNKQKNKSKSRGGRERKVRSGQETEKDENSADTKDPLAGLTEAQRNAKLRKQEEKRERDAEKKAEKEKKDQEKKAAQEKSKAKRDIMAKGKKVRTGSLIGNRYI